MSSALAFELPAAREARRPPEARGLERDQVRLMVVSRSDRGIAHASFRDLPDFIDAGDLLVFNRSATLPAAVPARLADGTRIELRFATPAPPEADPGLRWPGEWWVVELRSADGTSPFRRGSAAAELRLEGAARVELVAPYLSTGSDARLWLARFEGEQPVGEYLARHGRPIRYRYVPEEWPLEAYQTAFALEPGSAEMPSAARPFTPALITRLITVGVQLATVTLHTGVSSPEHNERPYPERFVVPEVTARLVNAVRGWGGRVIAVGTTVVRALETAATPGGEVTPRQGWSDLVVTPERGLRAVDGLITGWHEPRASHLRLLEAATGRSLLERSYEEALEHGYLWHEFGDSQLIL